MKITRDNYESWFVDFLDGNLDDESRKQLFVFLEHNPDLAEELNLLDNIHLEPETLTFQQSDHLLKSEADLMGIPYADFLLIKQMEEGLSDTEKKELDKLIGQDDRLIKRGMEYQNAHLSGEAISYQGKDSLMKKQVISHFIPFIRTAVAAAVLVLIFLGYQLLNPFVNPRYMTMTPLQPLTNIQFPEGGIADSFFIAAIKPVSVNENAPTQHPEKIESIHHALIDKNTIDTQTRLAENINFLTPISLKNGITVLPENIPNAYETGLRHMMPMYLDIHNNRRLLAAQLLDNPVAKENGEGIFLKGLQFFDKVGGDLIRFQPVFDDEGNFIAYNFKAGAIEMAKKIKR